MTVINIPIESLEERYSAQWNEWIPGFFRDYKIPFLTIDPAPLSTTIRQGEFLDVIGTNYYKASQLAAICKLFDNGLIKDGDTFFFNDLWFPGIEMLFYIRDALEFDFKITGILHAGCYDCHDFLVRKGMNRWGWEIERSWFGEVDTIFVATEYHKKLIRSAHGVVANKVKVTGLPFYWDRPTSVSSHKEKIVVFPHRLAPEKQPELFDQCASLLSALLPDWQFIKTKDVCNTKEEYYQLLERSRIAVSFAEQETWGIAMQEAVMAGCVPLCPDRLSYPELYPEVNLYSSTEDTFLVKLLGMMRDSEHLDFLEKYKLHEIRSNIRTNGKQALVNIVGHFHDD